MTTPSHTLMVVDDDVDFLDVYRRILENAGYRVVCCTTPDEAQAAMAAATPDLIVTDLMMATLDSGFSFAQQIKENPRLARIPVIIITAADSQRGLDFRPQTPEDLSAMHADAFFTKPVDAKPLLAKVRDLLRQASPAPKEQTDE